MLLSEILYKTGITLKPIQAAESDFGESYRSPFVKGPHKFYSIHVFTGATKVGEIEYGDVDENTIEIISIHVNKVHRGKGFAQSAIDQLLDIVKKNNVILKAAPTSKKFWTKFGFKPTTIAKDYYAKNY